MTYYERNRLSAWICAASIPPLLIFAVFHIRSDIGAIIVVAMLVFWATELIASVRCCQWVRETTQEVSDFLRRSDIL